MNTNVKEQEIMTADIVEEKAGNALHQVQTVTRKSYYAYLGMWRMIYDGAVETIDYSKQIFDKAVERGEEIEKMVLDEAQSTVSGMISTVETQANDVQKRFRKNVRLSEEKLENQVDAALKRITLPDPQVVDKLRDKLDMLTKKIDTMGVTEAPLVVEEPLAEYDELTAKEIVSKLGGLTMEQIANVKQYELAHENRVTVLRAADRRLKAMNSETAVV